MISASATAKKKGKVAGREGEGEERGQAGCHLGHLKCGQAALSAAVLYGETDRLGRRAASVSFREKQSQGQPQGQRPSGLKAN